VKLDRIARTMGNTLAGRMEQRRTARLALAATSLAMLIPASAAASQSGAQVERGGLPPEPAITVAVGAPVVKLLDSAQVTGSVAAPTPGGTVTVQARAGKRVVFDQELPVDEVTGEFSTAIPVRTCCTYVVSASTATDEAEPVSFRVRLPNKLGKGPVAKMFNRKLRGAGYHMGSIGKKLNWASRLGILAFRKVNGMKRNTAYSKRIFRKLLLDTGSFKPRMKGKGRHVEADLSRQVMAFVVNGRPTHVFHISSGTPSTPTVTGKFRFYLRQPGYNGKMMYYSIYFTGNYATHGFNPVPTYPASHGCLRNPIPYSKFIYNWVQLGMMIWVYQ